MNKDLLETQWPQVRNFLKEKFSNLTEEDIRQINGHYDQLVSKLQQKYGYSREEAEERILNWNFDRFAASTPQMREGVREDKRFVEKDSTSFLKWVLALGIPLLLLATYFLTTTPEVTRAPVTPTTTAEQRFIETPADIAVSNSIRNALLSQQNLANEISNVQVATSNGVVTLSGTVTSEAVRNSIVRTTQNQTGVRQVIDNLQIRSNF